MQFTSLTSLISLRLSTGCASTALFTNGMKLAKRSSSNYPNISKSQKSRSMFWSTTASISTSLRKVQDLGTTSSEYLSQETKPCLMQSHKSAACSKSLRRRFGFRGPHRRVRSVTRYCQWTTLQSRVEQPHRQITNYFLVTAYLSPRIVSWPRRASSTKSSTQLNECLASAC